MQASLAQYYFQLRTLDADQKLLDDTVIAYTQALKLVQDRFKTGVASEVDVVQASIQLETAKSQAVDNGIARAQFEHAIAVLIGIPPACFSLPPCIENLVAPCIPLKIPSVLLERRPDVAQTERLVAQANANIGVAIAAFFPKITLTATDGFSTNALKNLFSKPAKFWSLGALFDENLFDGGLQRAILKATWASYDQTVATYRQTVLAAFQDVEDNLVSLTHLNVEIKIQKAIVSNAKKNLTLVMAQYTAGTLAYSDVIIAQNILYSSQKNLSDTIGRQMVSAVSLVKALGGGWKGLMGSECAQ